MNDLVIWRLEPIRSDDKDLSCLTSWDDARFRRSSARARAELLAGRKVVRDLVVNSGWCDWKGVGQGEFGRPILRGANGVSVSISHSRGWVLAALTRGMRIGVDVEVVTPLFDEEALIRRACSSTEVARLQAAPHASRRALLADLWTAKEAILKARGRGLRDDPRRTPAGSAEVHRLSSATSGVSAAYALLPLD